MTSLWRPRLRDPIFFNSGGPMSRTREEVIRSTVLGSEDAVIRCPRVIRLALEFDDQPPVAGIERLLAAHFDEPAEWLRERFEIPKQRLICRVDANPEPLKVAVAPPEAVLEAALILGLCTQVMYDPARPVLWTVASLTRRLELFDPEGFYA